MPSLQRRRLQCYLVLMLGDIMALFASFAIAGYSYRGHAGMADSLILAQLLLPIYLTVALFNGAYSITALRRKLWPAGDRHERGGGSRQAGGAAEYGH